MKRFMVTAAFIAVASMVPAAVAQAEPTVSRASSADPGQLVSKYFDDLFNLQFDKALADVKGLDPDRSNKDGVAMVSAMRAAALLGLKRDADAEHLIAQIHDLASTDPFPASTLFLGGLLADRFGVAADAFDELIARFPDAAREQDKDLVLLLLRNEPKGQDPRNEDRRIALARIGYGGNTGTARYMAFDAAKMLVKRGDTAGANGLLNYVGEPSYYENMLIQKRYAALWPKLEELGGPHLGKLRSSSLASAEQAYAVAPDDPEKLQAYVDALRHSGRLADAAALRSKLPTTAEAMAKADEPTGWAINSVAHALYEAGRIDEGDQLFAALNGPPRKDAGWRVSMIINRLEMVVTSGKFDRAAALLDAAEFSARNDGNPYAQQLVRRLRFCTLSSLGKKDAAAKLLPDVLAHADDALEPTVEGLLCAGEIDKAEQLWLKALNDKDESKRQSFEEDFVHELQPAQLTDDEPYFWWNSWKSLRQRPAIAAAYERLGRDLPTDLLPEAKSVAAN